MNKWVRFAILLTFLAVLALPIPARAAGLWEDRVVFGNNFTLKSGETLNGNLVVFGGNVTLETGSQVTGDVVLFGGNLESSGTIEGDIVGLGGLVSLNGTAVVGRNITMIGAHLQKAEGAHVGGEVITNLGAPLSFTFPGGVQVPRFDVNFSPVVNVIWFFFKAMIWAALAVLAVLFLPEHVRRVGETAISQPIISGGMGLLTVVVVPVLMLAMAITILLIPVSLLVAALAALAWAFGLIALGLELGNRLAELFKQEWAPAAAAGAGTLVLILVLNGLREIVWCVGWVFPALVGMVGLGAVILTRVGTQTYHPAGGVALVRPVNPPSPPSTPQMPTPPSPPEAPEPPQPPTG
jgi:hypothetical protein